jgi:hypothetical protein
MASNSIKMKVMNTEEQKIVFELYDGRYLDNPEDATCFEICESLKEAHKEKDEYGTNTVIVKRVLKHISGNKYAEVSSEIVHP